MKRFAAVACGLVVGLAIAAPASAAVRVAPAGMFAKQSKALHRVNLPVLLPTTMVLDASRRPVTEGGRTRYGYSLRLVGAPGCNGGGACTLARFTASGGQKVSGQRVPLRGGKVGYYKPMRCGASCAKPSIQWRELGFTFTIEAAVLGTPAVQRTNLMAAANQAIVAGPRR